MRIAPSHRRRGKQGLLGPNSSNDERQTWRPGREAAAWPTRAQGRGSATCVRTVGWRLLIALPDTCVEVGGEAHPGEVGQQDRARRPPHPPEGQDGREHRGPQDGDAHAHGVAFLWHGMCLPD